MVLTFVVAAPLWAQEEGPAEAPEANENDTAAAAATPAEEKQVPDTEAQRRALLTEQYPPQHIRHLDAGGDAFTALWRKDQSGDAFGAVLLVPGDGQTANWPHTIDVLRNDLPQNGWSTLAIDIQPLPTPPASALTGESSPDLNGRLAKNLEQNIARIQAAIRFLNEQGQFNIIVVGYGRSAYRVMEFAQDDAGAAPPSSANTQTFKMTHPVRALILINPKHLDGSTLAYEYGDFRFKAVPVLDIIFGTHYLDHDDAKTRQQEARAARFENYVQLKLMKPTSTVFSEENRLSRRVRGFLNKYAKGVEIERR